MINISFYLRLFILLRVHRMRRATIHTHRRARATRNTRIHSPVSRAIQPTKQPAHMHDVATTDNRDDDDEKPLQFVVNQQIAYLHVLLHAGC